MSIQTIQKHNVVNAVYEQMKEKLLDGSWPPGCKLPSESELTTLFSVSRVSIRSAVQRLRDLGVVITQQGKGTFVTQNLNRDSLQNNTHKPIMHLSREEFFDMMVFRQTVEFKCMELAVLNAMPEDIVELEQALMRMLSNKDDYKKYSQADFDFHLAIARASQNKVFYNVMKSIKDSYYYYLEELNRALGITLESVEAHIKVFMAIKNKDSSTAVAVLNEAMSNNSAAIEKLTHPGKPADAKQTVKIKGKR